MLGTILFRVFCLPVSSLKTQKIKTFTLIIIPVVLYGTEAWSLTLREEHRLRVSENMALRGIFVHKRDEMAGGWKRLHNEELHKLYVSPNVIRVNKS
jgi:hypothetical protein